MRRTALLVGVAGLSLVVAMAACSTVTPDAGQEAVLVRKPLLFGHGGVDPTPAEEAGGRSTQAR